MTEPSASPNPRRVEAGRRSRQKWRGFSADGIQRLRQAALANRPWEHSTGPRTAAGKARSVENCRVTQKGPRSVRQLRAELAEFKLLITQMRAGRKELADGRGAGPTE
jgi:hypothetical protein